MLYSTRAILKTTINRIAVIKKSLHMLQLIERGELSKLFQLYVIKEEPKDPPLKQIIARSGFLRSLREAENNYQVLIDSNRRENVEMLHSMQEDVVEARNLLLAFEDPRLSSPRELTAYQEPNILELEDLTVPPKSNVVCILKDSSRKKVVTVGGNLPMIVNLDRELPLLESATNLLNKMLGARASIRGVGVYTETVGFELFKAKYKVKISKKHGILLIAEFPALDFESSNVKWSSYDSVIQEEGLL